MASPQEYRSKISEMGLDKWSFCVTSIQEAQKSLSQVRDFQSNLWELKRAIKVDVSVIWDNFREEAKDSSGDSIVAAFLGRRRSNRIRKHTREQLAKNHDQLIAAYREVESIIDDLLKQLDDSATKLRSFIDKLSTEDKKRRQESTKRRTPQNSQPTNYKEYIKSQEWREKAEEAKARAGNRCQVCNRSRAEVQLDAHHRTYERLGNERPEDISVLCRECHQLYEDTKKALAVGSTELSVTGFCIRCKESIKLAPQTPYCYSCFKVWKRFENMNYQEKYCHICGKEHPSTMSKPSISSIGISFNSKMLNCGS